MSFFDDVFEIMTASGDKEAEKCFQQQIAITQTGGRGRRGGGGGFGGGSRGNRPKALFVTILQRKEREGITPLTNSKEMKYI